jgi:hypothetical protein
MWNVEISPTTPLLLSSPTLPPIANCELRIANFWASVTAESPSTGRVGIELPKHTTTISKDTKPSFAIRHSQFDGAGAK